MANNQDYLLNSKSEKFESFKLNRDLSKFDISQNMVIFFDLENNYKTHQYIKNKFEALRRKFKEVDKNFIYFPNLDCPKEVADVIKFYLPYLCTNDLEQFNFTDESLLKSTNLIADPFNIISKAHFSQSEYQSIINYIGYEGNIKCGFIFFDKSSVFTSQDKCNTSILECNDFILKDNPDAFFKNLTAYFYGEKVSDEDYGSLSLSPCFVDDPFENVDKETIETIREIESQLITLKNSGQLLFALPILKKILNDEANKINLNSSSSLLIDDEYSIILPNFNSLEIQLSHLTKVVYVLFYKNPHGINIKELYKYKQELQNLYSSISNQLDYDKMMQSIEDLINPESKAIYTHISRIKSAFYKQMDMEYAKNFIIAGNTFGNDFKYISIIKP
jgi:hypothetical protein